MAPKAQSPTRGRAKSTGSNSRGAKKTGSKSASPQRERASSPVRRVSTRPAGAGAMNEFNTAQDDGDISMLEGSALSAMAGFVPPGAGAAYF